MAAAARAFPAGPRDSSGASANPLGPQLATLPGPMGRKGPAALPEGHGNALGPSYGT
jgi:hypothetical protein